MRTIAFILSVIGGLLYIAGGIAFYLSPESAEQIKALYENGTFYKVLDVLRIMAAAGGLTVIAGGLIGYLISPFIGSIIILIGCCGGIPNMIGEIWSAWRAGIFTMPDFSLAGFMIRRGLEFSGTVFSFLSFLLFR